MEFQISAPGKVILHGEHAVVYGTPALAAVLGLRTQLDLKINPNSKIAKFYLENLSFTFEIELSEIQKFVKEFKVKNHASKCIGFNQLLDAIKQEVLNKNQTSIEDPNGSNRKAFLSIYYLFCGTFLNYESKKTDEMFTGFELRVKSDLNAGSGLGSSASFGVIIATAFLLLTKQIPIVLTDESRAKICKWAFESERVMHGNPSGVDNTVCTYGGIVRFVKGQSFNQIKITEPINILLVDTKVNRSTEREVAKVRELWQTFPKLVGCIWSAIEEIVKEAVPVYEKVGKHSEADLKVLERLFRINNDLMKAVGVSHPKLEEIFAIASRNGFASKLTGAGGGGYAIILLKDNYKNMESFVKLCEELKASNFYIQETTVGGEGVNIQYIT